MARVLERLEVRNGPTGSTDTSVVDIIPDVVSAVTNQQVDPLRVFFRDVDDESALITHQPRRRASRYLPSVFPLFAYNTFSAVFRLHEMS